MGTRTKYDWFSTENATFWSFQDVLSCSSGRIGVSDAKVWDGGETWGLRKIWRIVSDLDHWLAVIRKLRVVYGCLEQLLQKYLDRKVSHYLGPVKKL